MGRNNFPHRPGRFENNQGETDSPRPAPPKRFRGDQSGSDLQGQGDWGGEASEPRQEAVGGMNAVLAALKSRASSCRAVMLAEGRRSGSTLAEIVNLTRSSGLSLRTVPRSALDRVYGQENHQGVVALFDAASYTRFEDFLTMVPADGPGLILALDQVEDPGNLGALMRSALAFGAQGVVVPRERTAPLTPAALRASAGAAEVLPLVRVVNLRRSLEELQDAGFWLAGAEGEGGQNLFDFDFPERTVLILGSEGRGLSANIKKNCDFLLTIPQQQQDVSSLNVSVAGGILMAAYFRQFS